MPASHLNLLFRHALRKLRLYYYSVLDSHFIAFNCAFGEIQVGAGRFGLSIVVTKKHRADRWELDELRRFRKLNDEILNKAMFIDMTRDITRRCE